MKSHGSKIGRSSTAIEILFTRRYPSPFRSGRAENLGRPAWLLWSCRHTHARCTTAFWFVGASFSFPWFVVGSLFGATGFTSDYYGYACVTCEPASSANKLRCVGLMRNFLQRQIPYSCWWITWWFILLAWQVSKWYKFRKYLWFYNRGWMYLTYNCTSLVLLKNSVVWRI